MGFIYMLTSPSGKSYIGQSIRPIEKRLAEHQLLSSKCRAIRGAIQKYGWENFDIEWYDVPDEDLNFYEEMLVALLGTLASNGYNLREGGGSHGKMSAESKKKMSEAKLGKQHTEETKKKLSEVNSGKKHYMYGKTHTEETKKKMSDAKQNMTEEHKKNISKSHIGKTHTDETKKKIGESQIGKTHTDETKKKMSKAHTGRTLSEETKKKISKAISGEKNHNYGKTGEKNPNYGKTPSEETKKKISKAISGEKHPKSKKVYQYELDGTYVDWFWSSGEAARKLNESNEISIIKCAASIRKCAGGKLESVQGYKWSRTEL
jgi:group I intron endonuclease